MVKEVLDGVFTFEVTLPNNPLKWLNCYVVLGKEGGRNLLIDSGFRCTECMDSLQENMRFLGLEASNTDVLFTHLHTDHTGNADRLQAMGYKLLMGETDYKVIQKNADPDFWNQRSRSMGISPEIMQQISKNNPALIYASKSFTADLISDGDVLNYGNRKFECILTPGHTPGHMCFYDRDDKMMLTGDHVLFDITPNIVAWLDYPDSLGMYLKSLKRIREFDVLTVLPSHRTTGGKTLYERVDELLEHHKVRLEETLKAASEEPGGSAYDLAKRVTWRIKAKNWSEFPPGQKWFAVGECLAHLEHLTITGRLRAETDAIGAVRYYPKN